MILEKGFETRTRIGTGKTWSLSLNYQDWKSYLKTLQTNPPPIFRFGWMAPFMDPLTHLRVFTSGEINNYTGCSNAKYDQLIEEIERLKPGIERRKKIEAAQKILLEDEAVVIPIYHYVQNTGISERVKGFQMNPSGIILFKDLEFGLK